MIYTFKSLDSLKYTRGLNDAQLATVASNASTCAPPKRFSYEDEVCSFLVQYLSLITGIEWRRAYEQSSRMSGQYGIVHLLSVNPTRGIKTERIEIEGGGICEAVTTNYEYDFQFDVYRGSGTKTSYNEPTAVNQPHASAIDVLSKVSMRSQLLVFSQALSQYGIHAGQLMVRINNVSQELKQGVFEEHATMRPTLNVCISQSIKVSTVEEVQVADCSGLIIEALPEDGNC